MAKTALKVRGSERDIDHVIWEILDTTVMTAEVAHNLLRRLPPELQCLILNSNQTILQKTTYRLLGQFERRTSLDSLALLTLIMKLRLSEESYEEVWKIGFSVHRMLLVLGRELRFRRIDRAIHEIYFEQMFSKIKFNGEKFYFKHFQYFSLSFIFPVQVTAIQYPSIWKYIPKKRVWSNIFKGEFGKARAIVFNPITGPDLDLGPQNENAIKTLHDKWKEYHWCFENLFSLSVNSENLVPEDYFFDEINSFAIFRDPVVIEEGWVDANDIFPSGKGNRSVGQDPYARPKHNAGLAGA